MTREMKYAIIGFHCSGKDEIIRDIEQSTLIPCGKSFTNMIEPIEGAYTCNSETFDNNEISTIFENQAYLFLREVTDFGIPYYDGMTLHEFDSSAVICLTPDQMVSIAKFPAEMCFVWLDNTTAERRQRHTAEKRKHDFQATEDLQRQFSDEFINKLYGTPNSHLLYFNNEEPQRVSAVIQALIKHPDLLPLFESRYN